MSAPQAAQATWQAALTELQLQMTRATFDTWLKPTYVLDADDHSYRIGCHSGYAKDWLENQLRAPIQRALAHITGQPVEVQFVVRPSPLPNPNRGTTPEPESESEIESIEIVEFDPTKRGWTAVPFYSEAFWQPYLGPGVYNTYRLLLASAWYAKQTGRWPSIQRIADTVARGDRKAVTGRNERGTGDNYRPPVEGYLQRLEHEGIIRVRRRGEGRKTRYKFVVLASLPLLTPAQVSLLSPLLQEAHQRFIGESRLDLDQWEQIATNSLIPEDDE